MKLRLTDISAESYQRLAARLKHLCRTNFKGFPHINVAIAFAEGDLGTGSAALWLTKHFSAFPVEIGCSDGKACLEELERIMRKPGMALVVQSLPHPVQGEREAVIESHSLPEKIELHKNGNALNHLPVLAGLKDSVERTLAQRLFDQISVNSKFLTEMSIHVDKPVIYVAGFNLIDKIPQNSSLPFANILPWYLLICDGRGNTRIYKQPELSYFLEKLPLNNSNIVDLEDLIASMDSDLGVD